MPSAHALELEVLGVIVLPKMIHKYWEQNSALTCDFFIIHNKNIIAVLVCFTLL